MSNLTLIGNSGTFTMFLSKLLILKKYTEKKSNFDLKKCGKKLNIENLYGNKKKVK